MAIRKISGHPQGGNLLLRNTSLGEYGLLLGGEKKIEMAIWWGHKQDMIYDLKKVISILEAV